MMSVHAFERACSCGKGVGERLVGKALRYVETPRRIIGPGLVFVFQESLGRCSQDRRENAVYTEKKPMRSFASSTNLPKINCNQDDNEGFSKSVCHTNSVYIPHLHRVYIACL
jgi:hypothetical protein